MITKNNETPTPQELLEAYKHMISSDERLAEAHRENWRNEQQAKGMAALPNKYRKQIQDGTMKLVVTMDGYKDPTPDELEGVRQFFQARIDDLQKIIDKDVYSPAK